MSLQERLQRVRGELADAAGAAGRNAQELTLIVVTKFHSAALVRELAELGVTDVGESRVQEAAPKAAELTELGLRWHFVGQLQSKKARTVRGFADVIHSVDRPSLLRVLDDEERTVDCFLQVNLSDDPGRGGVRPEEAEAMTEQILATPGLALLGVMAIAPLEEEPRSAFARLREAGERVRALAPTADRISAGMSGDFREAILEGATHLRIGTAITGKRPDAP